MSMITSGDPGPAAAGALHLEREMAPDDFAGASRRAWAYVRSMPGPRPPPSPIDRLLPANDFLQELRRERRRTERSGAPLSLIRYRIVGAAADDPDQIDRLIETLHTSKRETDVVGHVGADQLAVLCPDTDARGVQGLLRKIGARVGELSFPVESVTFPHDLFDNLGSPENDGGDPVDPFLGRDTTHRDDSYPFKRVLDVLLALAILAVVWPLMGLVALAVALDSRGPVLFRQQRLGLNARPFIFYKFRSMTAGGSDAIHRDYVAALIRGTHAAALAESGSSPYKLKSDPRVTRIGRLIRKTSMDELPQLINVLKGDMSLVGPRPPLPYETQNYQAWHLRRIFAVRPGITGLWQVEGRSRVTFDDMVRMDLRYIRNCSLGLDLHILAKTVPVVLSCDGAN